MKADVRRIFTGRRALYERAKNANEALQNQVATGAKQAFYDLLFAQQAGKVPE